MGAVDSVEGFVSVMPGDVDFPGAGDATREFVAFGSLLAVRAALRRFSASCCSCSCCARAEDWSKSP